ncbi:MAG: selenide, water dikinase SelD [Congregibacter sp.]
MRADTPPQHDLVLVGGGHAHALVLRQLAMQAPATLRVTLISPDPFTPYSGMLPGLIAGHYTFEQAHIDLARLCQWAGVRFYADTVVSLDPERRRLQCRERGELTYDYLSIDIGSQPEIDSVPGAREHAVPVKPVAGLWARWEKLSTRDSPPGQRIAVVGGGAGSVEIALAVAFRLAQRQPQIALYCGGERILPGYSSAVRRRVDAAFAELGVDVHCGHRVVRVEAETLHFASSDSTGFDSLVWCTGAAAAPWIVSSGLSTDERGFMRVEDTLQSSSHPDIFGAGDIAAQHGHLRPKAGVYAVRQAPVLAHNLMAIVAKEALRVHLPQTRFLSMLALGPRRAVAQRNGLSVAGNWVWRWKDHIDQTFMRRFVELPPPGTASTAAGSVPSTNPEQALCGGCGAKIDANVLHAVLDEMRARYPDVTPPAEALDDAAVLDVRESLVQSLDALRALVDDPWMMGRIAAQHALSDLYACGAKPHSAQALITLPFADAALLRRDLAQTLAGALAVFSENGCRLLGGHSMQGPELQIGFAVNGVLDTGDLLPKKGGKSGDVLVLTKALGTGALFAAHMQLRADGRNIAVAVASMLRSNAAASRVAREQGARAVTDVTGFGLAVHLLEMLTDDLSASLMLDALPRLPGAEEAMRCGIFSTMHAVNRNAAAGRCSAGALHVPEAQLLFDPQTSGGLLMALPAENVQLALQALRKNAYEAEVIGHLVDAEALQPRLRFT